MKSWIVILVMVLVEIGTNAHAFFPDNMIGQTEQNGVIAQAYQAEAIDPWTVRMVSLFLAFAFVILFGAFFRFDANSKSFMVAWALYWMFQAIQKMSGMNIAESLWKWWEGRPLHTDWAYDAGIMCGFIVAAHVHNRFIRPAYMKVVHRA